MKDESNHSDLNELGPLEAHIKPQSELLEETLSQVSNKRSQDQSIQAYSEVSKELVIVIQQ